MVKASISELEPYGVTPHGADHMDGKADLLEYLKTARELEVGLLELEKMTEHQREQIDMLSRKQYPSFDPPHKNIADERNSANENARSAGGTIGGLLYAIVDGWHMVSDSNNPLLVGNFFVTGGCMGAYRSVDRHSATVLMMMAAAWASNRPLIDTRLSAVRFALGG